MASRMTFVCHGSTAATRRTAFPLDEPLEPGAREAATALGQRLRLPVERLMLAGPTLRCRQTAELLRTAPAAAATATPAAAAPVTADEGLADWDLGDWAGRTLDELGASDPTGVEAWIVDPAAAPHGGEPLSAVVERVGRWLDDPPGGRPQRLVAVTHPAVIRAAIVHTLRAPVDSFWRIDVTPLAVVEVRGRPGRWSLHP